MSYDPDIERTLSELPVVVAEGTLFIPLAVLDLIGEALHRVGAVYVQRGEPEKAEAYHDAAEAPIRTSEYLTMMHAEHIIPDTVPDDLEDG